jgi:hypothetical protein
MSRSRGTRGALLLAAALQLPGCGGSSSGSPTGGSTGSPGSSSPPASASNPCGAALAELPQASAAQAAGPAGPKAGALGWDVRDPHEFLGLHQVARAGLASARAAGLDVSAAAVPTRSGDIALIADNGSLVVGANNFDLGGLGLRFDPNAQGGYDVVRTASAFRGDLGRKLTLGDDATTEEPLGFGFSFYGAARGSTFVNSDGNLTFTSGDVGTDDRSLGRVLSGPPRAALFFADLDATKGGGIFESSSASAFTVTWCGVANFDNTGKLTAQVTLLPGGSIEMRFDSATTLRDAVVALSPGATTAFASLDLSTATAAAPGGGGAVGERFATVRSIDLTAASRVFYSAFGDDYDQLVFFTDTRVTDSDTFAYESTVQNAIQGIGSDIVDLSSQYGSGGRLASVVLMDTLTKYPADPAAQVNGEYTPTALVGHETGHRWGATLKFRDSSGAVSDAWLGRQLAHWSFFTDADASVLDGNDIQDQGGSFKTLTPVERYSPFDLYSMGVLAESEVPSTFYVDNGIATDPPSLTLSRETAPRSNVTMTGTRRDVTIAQVVSAMGARSPAAGSGPFQHRQAWIYVTSAGQSADAASIAKLDGFRRAFESFFASATGGRMSLETRLQ